MKNRIIALKAFLLAAVVCCSCVTSPTHPSQTVRQYLSGRDGEHTAPWEFFCGAGRNSGYWTNIAVPSCWETQGFGTFRYGLEDKPFAPIEAQYRHRFQVPADWRGRRIFLVFDGVMTDAQVKVNGQEAGPLHQGAFYRFKFDVTDRLKFGAENLLEVTVRDKSADASVNNAERNADFWVFGGIFRPVWLDAQPAQFLDQVAIDARADGSFAMNYGVAGAGGADAVEVTIQDARGKTSGPPFSAPVAAGTIQTKISGPALWTAETPALYTAVVRLKQGATVLHEIKQRFGFRTIEVRAGDGIYVNGQRVMFRGLCHHVAWPTLGRSSSDRIARLDVDLIQDMNMDAVRMTHYPPDEEFLDLCDEKGLYVFDELTGWQHKYDTDIGRAKVKEMIPRDVNHPCILMWDNGNEGGWNTNLDADFAPLDPQHRIVEHPGGNKFGAIYDRHYPIYSEMVRELAGKDIVMPTEFLHGLYDGGAGAGLEDYWNAMRASKVSAGGFIWVFADEGVVRNDETNFMDVKGNWAPDGILGPYREKEGSFYTIKQIYSPVQLPKELPADFDGTLPVENRYEFINLSQCHFTWQLRSFGLTQDFQVIAQGATTSQNVGPGQSGKLQINLPTGWKNKNASALAVTVRNPAGQELWTWVWSLQSPSFSPGGQLVVPNVAGNEMQLKAGGTEARIDRATGNLLGIQIAGQAFSLKSALISEPKWTMLDSGWLKLEYACDPTTQSNVVGMAFDYPEEKMLKKTWLGDGPYRVWRNRLLGVKPGVWTTAYNTTETGFKDWVYPEFAGYFSNMRWLRLDTTEGRLTVMIPDEHTFMRVGTPKFPEAKLSNKAMLQFPDGNLAVLRDVPAIGNKFHTASQTGPHATTPLARDPYHGTIYLRFEPPTAK